MAATILADAQDGYVDELIAFSTFADQALLSSGDRPRRFRDDRLQVKTIAWKTAAAPKAARLTRKRFLQER
jgi:hypothetical protein